jgi:predicted NBD/HSP70 family sugar kinase
MPNEEACTLEDIRRALEVGLAKIDGRLTSIEKHLDRTDSDVADLKTRVASMERRVWTASGAAALVGMAVPYVVRTMGA